MKKKIPIIALAVVFISIIIFGGVKFYKKWQIDHAVIKVQLIDNLDKNHKKS